MGYKWDINMGYDIPMDIIWDIPLSDIMIQIWDIPMVIWDKLDINGIYGI